MRRRIVATVFGTLCGCGGEPAPPVVEAPKVPEGHAAVLQIAERVTRELDCTKSMARYLCSLTLLPGEPFELPATNTTWIGISVAVRASRTLEDGSLETASMAQLTLGPKGAWVTAVRPSSEVETVAMGQVLTNASMAAKGSATQIEVPFDLLDYLRASGDTMVPWPVRRDEHGWAFDARHPARLYRVPASDPRPASLVVVEVAPYGSYVSVFPDVPLVEATGGLQPPGEPVVNDPPPPPGSILPPE